ncbi:MAG: rod shape-determining protein MreD [Cellvibrio sp.]
MRETPIVLWLVVTLSVVAALLLAIFPLPLDWQWWRPEFVLLIVIYWVVTLNTGVSLLGLCLLGLFQDVLESVPLGQHGLSVILIAYLCLLSYQRVRKFSVIKQCAWVFVLVGVAQLSDNWVQGMAGHELSGLNFLKPAVASALVWPFLKLWLDRLAYRYHLFAD